MNRTSLISQSRKHYWRYYRLMALAVIIMMAVLSGSLFLGDSVRGTLVQRVTERLGQTETVITSGTGFMNEEIMETPLLHEAQGLLLADGFVSIDGKLIPVYVWGTDSDSLQYGEVFVNEPLARKLADNTDIVLHLPSHNLVPSGTLFVTQSYATQMRLRICGQKSVEEGGNLLLKNEQTLPLNVFVNRKQLAEVMELDGKINLILSDKYIEQEQLNDAWHPALSGIHITDSSLTYDGIFIPNELISSILSPNPPSANEIADDLATGSTTEATTKNVNEDAARRTTLYFSYLVNDLICDTDTVPYSFVTAVTNWQGEALTGNDIILSDYAAEHLHVTTGDSIRMSYFLAKDLKNLETREQTFRVKDIVPLSDLMQDSLLTAEFPGLSNVERCTDWDSDLPIKMDRVHKVDEDFWYKYRQTPKAIVAYDAVKKDWVNRFGSATALRFSPTSPSRSSSAASSLSPSMALGELSSDQVSLLPSDAGITIIHPRMDGLTAASSGVDFASLFLALGAFIIMAAIMLMASPLHEMLVSRISEMQLYQQLGFTQQRIKHTLYRETFGILIISSPLGILAGFLYANLTLWLLGNWWSGATHTEGFAFHSHLLTFLIALTVGGLLCMLTFWYIIRRVLRASHTSQAHTHRSSHWWICFAFLLFLTLTLIAINFIALHSMMLFILCGLLWVVTFGLFLRARIIYKVENSTSALFSRNQLTWQSIHASLRQHLLAYWSLSLGVFTVFAVGLNRPDFSNVEQMSGGYQLYVECRVPLQYDLNNPTVRHKLSLDELPDDTHFQHFMRHTQDEASCLNLNKVSTPTILAATAPPTPEGEKGWLDKMLELQNEGTSLTPPRGLGGLSRGTMELLLDQESLIWSLMKSVGDTLHYQNGQGQSIPIVIAGSYPTGIFHGNAFMSSQDFRQLWPKESGVEVLLVQSSHPEQAAEILSTALSEYGLTIQTTEERIKMFFEVTETYLIIFLTLGGLGLLLGIFSLIIIVRKNLTAQRTRIEHYRTIGFSEKLIRQLLLRENLITPFYSILVGVIGSFISISANVGGAGIASFVSAIALLALLLLFIYFGVKQIIHKTI